jgi:hypothetical protein
MDSDVGVLDNRKSILASIYVGSFYSLPIFMVKSVLDVNTSLIPINGNFSGAHHIMHVTSTNMLLDE